MRKELSVAVGPAIPHLRRKGAKEGEIPGELAAAFKVESSCRWNSKRDNSPRSPRMVARKKKSRLGGLRWVCCLRVAGGRRAT